MDTEKMDTEKMMASTSEDNLPNFLSDDKLSIGISPKKIIFIEGGIANGKTTFLDNIEKNDSRFFVLREQLSDWDWCGNTLRKVAEDIRKENYEKCFAFQIGTFFERVTDVYKALCSNAEFILIERSVVSCFLFGKTQHLNKCEMIILAWFINTFMSLVDKKCVGMLWIGPKDEEIIVADRCARERTNLSPEYCKLVRDEMNSFFQPDILVPKYSPGLELNVEEAVKALYDCLDGKFADFIWPEMHQKISQYVSKLGKVEIELYEKTQKKIHTIYLARRLQNNNTKDEMILRMINSIFGNETGIDFGLFSHAENRKYWYWIAVYFIARQELNIVFHEDLFYYFNTKSSSAYDE